MNKFRIFDLIDRAIQKYSHKNNIFVGKDTGEWVNYSARQYKEYSDWFSIGLLELGIKKGDKVATVSNNRPEWNFIDMGIAQVGAAHTPIYATITNEDFDYILRHSEAKILIVSDNFLYKKLKPVVSKIKKIKTLYTINEIEGANNWNEIIELGKKKITKNVLTN